MNDDEILKLASYIGISKYRLNVVNAFDEDMGVKIPTQIAKDSKIRPNHISKVLRELKDKGIVICLNEDARKGRLYRLTPLGVVVRSVCNELF